MISEGSVVLIYTYQQPVLGVIKLLIIKLLI